MERFSAGTLAGTGLEVADLRVLPSAVARHLLRAEGYDAGFHVGTSQIDPEVVQIRFFEQPGIQLTASLQKEIEKNYTRGALRRVGFADTGRIIYPARVRETYSQDLLASLDFSAQAFLDAINRVLSKRQSAHDMAEAMRQNMGAQPAV